MGVLLKYGFSLQVGEHNVGIVGLNTTFPQLASGDYLGRLVMDVRQLNEVCSSAIAIWRSQHDAYLLLTRQSKDWLDEPSQKTYAEINPAGRFAMHSNGGRPIHSSLFVFLRVLSRSHRHEFSDQPQRIQGRALRQALQSRSRLGRVTLSGSPCVFQSFETL